MCYFQHIHFHEICISLQPRQQDSPWPNLLNPIGRGTKQSSLIIRKLCFLRSACNGERLLTTIHILRNVYQVFWYYVDCEYPFFGVGWEFTKHVWFHLVPCFDECLPGVDTVWTVWASSFLGELHGTFASSFRLIFWENGHQLLWSLHFEFIFWDLHGTCLISIRSNILRKACQTLLWDFMKLHETLFYCGDGCWFELFSCGWGEPFCDNLDCKISRERL
jgi:hypothetical protein